MKRQSSLLFLMFGLLALAVGFLPTDALLSKVGLAAAISSIFFAFSDCFFNAGETYENVGKLLKNVFSYLESELSKAESDIASFEVEIGQLSEENPELEVVKEKKAQIAVLKSKLKQNKDDFSDFKSNLMELDKKANQWGTKGNIFFFIGMLSLVATLTCYTEFPSFFTKIKELEPRLSIIAFSLIMASYWLQDWLSSKVTDLQQKYSHYLDNKQAATRQ